MSFFLFKGNRKYVHGTDIAIYLEKYVQKPLKLFDLKITKQIKTQPRILLVNSLKKRLKKSSATCKIKGKKNIFILFLETKNKVLNSYSYDESLLANNYYINKKRGKCLITTSLHSVEILVSLTKYWHQKRVCKGEWMFTRLKLNKWFNKSNIKNIEIENFLNLNNKSTISKVFENKKLIGEIFFSLNK